MKCLAILMLSGFVISCKKGDTGPAGTANVIFSDWFKPDTYKKDTIFGIWGFNYIQDAPAITQNVLDSGTVIVYGKLLGYNPLVWPVTQIAPLPISLTYVSGGTTTDTWSSLVSVGTVKIRFVNDKNTYGSISNAHLFRYVIIPGAKKATATNYARMSYEEVCTRLDIPK